MSTKKEISDLSAELYYNAGATREPDDELRSLVTKCLLTETSRDRKRHRNTSQNMSTFVNIFVLCLLLKLNISAFKR